MVIVSAYRSYEQQELTRASAMRERICRSSDVRLISRRGCELLRYEAPTYFRGARRRVGVRRWTPASLHVCRTACHSGEEIRRKTPAGRWGVSDRSS